MATTEPLHRAYVLHSRPYKESSLLLDVLSEQMGRIGVVARAGGKSGALKKAQLQPFRPLMIGLSGRSSLKSLSDIEAPTLALPLIGKALYSALYLNELCQRLLPDGQPVDGVFPAYHVALMQLAEEAPLEPVLRQFELVLLQQLGQLPESGQDADGNALSATSQYRWQPELGWVLLPAHVTGYSGASLLHWQQGQVLTDDELNQIKRATRAILKPLLGTRPLQSRTLFQTQRGTHEHSSRC